MNKKLEFGHVHSCSYSLHNAPVKDIFWNKNINCFASYDEKKLHVWDANQGRNVCSVSFFDTAGSHAISCVTYSSRYHLYLAVSTDFKLLIYTENLNFIGALELKVRLINHIHFWEKESKIITAGVGGCYVYNFIVKTKYEPRQALSLDPEGKNVQFKLGEKVSINKGLCWIKGLKVDEPENMIFCWSQEVTCFNMLEDGSKVAMYEKLTSYEDYITDLIISEEFKYFITSTMFGQIYVWKLNVSARLPNKDGKYGDEVDIKIGKSMKSKSKLIHSYTGHTKKVTSLMNHPENTIFISASLDNTVRIWCLDKFTELYCFHLVAGLTNIKLLNDKLFACFYSDKIKICKLQHLASSFCNPNSKVKKIDKCFDSLRQKEINSPLAIYIQCEDNSVMIYRPDGKQISTIYPPPTAKELKAVEYSMALNRFVILLKSGTLCVYKFDKETAILEKLQYPNQLKDSEGRAMNQTITCFGFCNVVPPRYDCEIVREGSYIEEGYQEESKTEDIMVLGFSKGTFAFVHVDNLESIYARFSIHRQAVKKVQQLTNKGIFVSICAELTLNVWGFTSSNIVVYKTFKTFRDIKQIRCDNSNLFLTFKTNDCELMVWDHSSKVLDIHHKEKTDDHESKVNCMDVVKACHRDSINPRLQYTNMEDHPSPQGLFVTGGEDGYVKVWKSDKTLVREICFPEPINTVCFMNSQCDILVGHGPKVSIIAAKDYKPFEEEETTMPNPYEESKETQPSVKKEEVTDLVFEKLKKREEELADELKFLKKRKKGKNPRNKFLMDQSISFEEGAGEESKNQLEKFREDNDLSKISFARTDESGDELVTEDMFQRALAATVLGIRNKSKKKKSRTRLPKRKRNVHVKKKLSVIESASKSKLTEIKEKLAKKMKESILHESRSNEMIQSKLDNYKKYKPVISALPKDIGNSPNIAERIRAAKRLHMTRRDITEQKIIRNIYMHNDPSDVQNFEVLYVSNKQNQLLHNKINREAEKSRNQFPPINHVTR